MNAAYLYRGNEIRLSDESVTHLCHVLGSKLDQLSALMEIQMSIEPQIKQMLMSDWLKKNTQQKCIFDFSV